MVGNGLDALAGVGHGDHQLAGVLATRGVMGAEGLLGPVPCVRLEGERLGRRAGLAGDDPERRKRVQVVDRVGDRSRVGRVQDAQVEPAVGRAEDVAEDLRREAAAAHPADDRRREPAVADRLPERLESRDLGRGVGRAVQPAEPVGDGGLDVLVHGPQRRVAVEEPLGPAFRSGPGDRLVERCLAGPERQPRRPNRHGCRGVGHRWRHGSPTTPEATLRSDDNPRRDGWRPDSP